MPKFSVERSVTINAPAEKVFGVISDLGNWRPWSPWLIAEPEAKVTVEEGGKAYRWSGKRTGEGEMKITRESAPREVDLDLLFLTPWKSEAKVAFRIEPQGEGCRVAWSMDSSLPFFMFFMKKMMTTLIGMDYDRGLSMLKDHVETGAVPSELEWIGEKGFNGFDYVGITTSCSIADVGQSMSADFEALHAWADKAGVKPSDSPFSLYHDWNFSKGTCKYTSGFPVSAAPASIPDSMESGKLPAQTVYQIGHTGPYRHVGNAWSTGMAMARTSKEIKQSKAKPFELYLNDPKTTEENQLKTVVCFPVK